ncbi:hypothetical protein [Deinococcus sedimenti]|uniref:Uncharacterized protein n=1 Tax=Deinococcus sedimenti TaxID=1867090 RepID=A0ABQ2SAC3_9DEIO|nr:hypothetical protein [Deinococcus sedimenti]GGS10612.1 hypothetical protein GCM10008960_40830 [Deinococcus sedimenti]
MLELQGTYTALPNKRLVIVAAPAVPATGVWAQDIQTLSDACEASGGCEVRFRSPFGPMAGMIKEKVAMKDRRRSFEGYVWFVRSDAQAATPLTS